MYDFLVLIKVDPRQRIKSEHHLCNMRTIISKYELSIDEVENVEVNQNGKTIRK